MLLPQISHAKGDLHYIAIVLDEASQQRAEAYARQHLPWADAKVIAHHMTMLHYTGLRVDPAQIEEHPELLAEDYVLSWALAHEGETFQLTATEVGYSDKAFALHVTDTPVPSRNRIKHITLATHPAAGGSAVDSNFIAHWQPLAEPLQLTGTINIFYKQSTQ